MVTRQPYKQKKFCAPSVVHPDGSVTTTGLVIRPAAKPKTVIHPDGSMSLVVQQPPAGVTVVPTPASSPATAGSGGPLPADPEQALLTLTVLQRSFEIINDADRQLLVDGGVSAADIEKAENTLGNIGSWSGTGQLGPDITMPILGNTGGGAATQYGYAQPNNGGGTITYPAPTYPPIVYVPADGGEMGPIGPQGVPGPAGPVGPPSFPDAPVDGKQYVRKNATWEDITNVHVGTSPPSNPKVGDIWIDTN